MQKKNVERVVAALQEITLNSAIKTKRGAADFYADRLRVASTTGDNLLAVVNRFSELLGSPVLRAETITDLVSVAASNDARLIVSWLREQPKIAIALTYVKKSEAGEALAAVAEAYQPQVTKAVKMSSRRGFDIAINVTLEEPLVHGDDKKAGNATLFRRAKVRGGAELPYYSANAFIGQMRDLLAMQYLQALGFDPQKPKQIKIWFYHLLFSGGIMADGAIPKAFEKELTKAQSGVTMIDGHLRLRNMIPFFSVLGGVGKYPMEGRIYANDLRPRCQEWGNGDEPLHRLMDWRFITRRDDYEGRTSNSQAKDGVATDKETINTSMIVNVEVLVEGAVLEGGIDLDRHITSMEKSALANGLQLMQAYGYLGGKIHRGFGRAKIEYATNDDTDLVLQPYIEFLHGRKDEILDYLDSIDALARGA